MSTQGFIERERKRLPQRGQFRLESLEALVQGEKRLKEIQMQQRSLFAGPVEDAETELVRLRAQVESVQRRCRVRFQQSSVESSS